jgi:hypothetical protein
MAAGICEPKQLRQEYSKFFKTEDGRAFTRSFGKSIPFSNGYRRNQADSIDFCDPADLPQSSMIDDPIDHIDPEENFSRLDGFTPEEIKAAVTIFETSMRWCLDAVGLVEIGLRTSIVISTMCPRLGRGLYIDSAGALLFSEANREANGTLGLAGSLFGPVLEWLRHDTHCASERGERVMVLFYVLRPDLIGGSTLASLGRMRNKTRQAKDKLANCLRDHSGIKARAMRAVLTRIRCNRAIRATPFCFLPSGS